MPVQTSIKPSLSQGAAGTHFSAWSANNGRIRTRGLELDVGAKSKERVFGLAAIRGTVAGETVVIPTTTFTADLFEGVVMNNFLEELELSGSYSVDAGSAVGTCDIGDIWVQVPDGVEPKYGEPIFVVTTGNGAGKFTNNSGAGVSIPGRFLGGRTDEGIAPVELRRG